jgi:hypothetical protein
LSGTLGFVTGGTLGSGAVLVGFGGLALASLARTRS